jgi:hypothetical protein
MNNPTLDILAMKEPNDNIDLKTPKGWFQWPCSSLHVGSTCSGKTITLTNLLYNKNFDLIHKLDEIYIFSGSGSSGDPSMAPFLKDFPDNLFDYYSDKKLQEILDKQLSYEKKDRPNIAIIIDDIIALKIKDRALIWGLFTMARHYNVVWVHVMAQRLRMIPPVARSNCSYLMLGKITNLKEKEIIMDEFGESFGKDNFNRCLKTATHEPYNFLWCQLRTFNPSLHHNFTKCLYLCDDDSDSDDEKFQINIDTKEER